MDRLPCPMCQRLVRAQARKCRHCHNWFDQVNRPPWLRDHVPQSNVVVIN